MESGKNITEIKNVQQAVEAAMQAVIVYITTSAKPTAEEAHTIIESTLAEHDCESSEGRIVAAGIQSAEPHEAGHGILPSGVPIVIDIFPRSKTTGYFADMTRTVCIGEPTPELAAMYEAVLGAQELAISMIKPDVRCSEIQQAAEEFFINKGYKTSGKGVEFSFAEGFVHAIGHGVGKKIHQAPHIGRNSKEVLREGDVITIEPGLYYKHIGGVRIEDMLLVTASGSENLTSFPKLLRVG